MADKSRAQLKALLEIAEEQARENLARALEAERGYSQANKELIMVQTENEKLTHALDNHIRRNDHLQQQINETSTTAQSVVIGIGKLFSKDGQDDRDFSTFIPPLPY